MQGHSFRTKDVLVSVRTELIEDLLVKQVVDGAELIFPVLHRGQEAPEIREEFVMDFLGGHGVDNHIALYNHGGLE